MSKFSMNFLMALAMFSWGVAWTNAKIVNEYLSFNNLIFLDFLLVLYQYIHSLLKVTLKNILSLKI